MVLDGMDPPSVAVGGKPRLLCSGSGMKLCVGALVATPSSAERRCGPSTGDVLTEHRGAARVHLRQAERQQVMPCLGKITGRTGDTWEEARALSPSAHSLSLHTHQEHRSCGQPTLKDSSPPPVWHQGPISGKTIFPRTGVGYGFGMLQAHSIYYAFSFCY